MADNKDTNDNKDYIIDLIKKLKDWAGKCAAAGDVEPVGLSIGFDGDGKSAGRIAGDSLREWLIGWLDGLGESAGPDLEPRDSGVGGDVLASLGDRLRTEWEKAHAEKVAEDLQNDINSAKDAFKKAFGNAFREEGGYSLYEDIRCAATSFALYGIKHDLFEIQQFRDELSEETAYENGLRKVDIEVWQKDDYSLKLYVKAWF